jgi:hypothetical protein
MRGWISGYGGGAQSRPFVKYTTNGGATWIEHTPQVGPYDSFAALAFIDDENGWAAGAGGIFRHGELPQVTPTLTAISTNTPVLPTATSPAATGTPVPPSATPAQPTNTPSSATPTSIPNSCTTTFTDVPQGSTFYAFVQCLACRNILSGYSDGTFRPGNDLTRGQLAKIVSNAAGFSEPVSGQSFSDVAPTHPFYESIQRMVAHGIISGYSDGTFRPQNNATRGQISKVVANAAGFEEPVSGQRFSDVAPTHPFYESIQRMVAHGIISGYSDGTFRPQNNATRGQIAKIVSNAFFPDCQP